MDSAQPAARGARSARHLLLSAMTAGAIAAGMVLLVAHGALAQTSDVEMSCTPETVRAGETTLCDVSGVAASTRATIEVRSGTSVVGQSSAIAGTDGRAAITVSIGADLRPGEVTLALRGTPLTFTVSVSAARPTGISAGLTPSSSSDVQRGVPLAVGLAWSLTLALALAPTLRAAGRRSALQD
jgi:hypothetical protein